MKTWHCAFLAISLLAGGCSGSTVKETLGLTRAAPDEYRVVSRPPLSVPPQFSLQPPSATENAPGQVEASAQAKSLILGNKQSAAVTPVASSDLSNAKAKPGARKATAADSVFLERAGAQNANPHVREEMVEERYSKQQVQDDLPWWNFWDSDDKKDPTVDAKKEAERIKTNEDEGKPVTEGTTPETKGRDTGLLGKIFDY